MFIPQILSKSAWCCIPLCALLLTSPGAVASGRHFMHYEYYNIDALTTAQLEEQVARRGPGADGMDLGLGLTRADVTWRYALQAQPDSCRVAGVEGSTEIAVTLPRVDPERADALPGHIRRQLEAFAEQVKQHEAVHEGYALMESGEGERRIAALPPQGDCQALNATINALISRIREKYMRLNADFDASSYSERKWPDLRPW